jgi:hypothetical protein
MPRKTLLPLALLLALAALLRFTGLDWGLRHVPHQDERSFVENVALMLTERDLDHRFYEYPGLFLYLLLPVQALAGVDGPSAYHAARGLTAAFGVASVGLVALLGVRCGGPWLGLVAALFLAVSPLEVITAHMVRPDVALETFALLVLLALRGVGPEPRGDLRAGAALAAAISIKFTGLLLLPSYLLARLLAPGERLRGVLRAGAVAVVLGALFTPYALLDLDGFVRGAGYQMAVHYKGQAPQATYLSNLGTLLRTFWDALGAPAAVLALAGLALALRRDRRREWAPAVLYPLVILGVMASVDLLYVRHVLPGLFVVALLAALPVQALAARRPWLAALLAACAAAAPLRTSWNYVGNVSGSLPRDRVLDWAEAHLPAGAVVLDARPELSVGFDRGRLEVIAADEQRGPLDRLLAENVDAILTGPGQGRRWGPLETLFPPGDGEAPVMLQLRRVPPARRARYAPLDLTRARVQASHAGERLACLSDGRGDCVWSPGGPQAPGQWLQVDFAEPVALARIELRLGPDRRRYAGDLRVWASADGRDWRRAPDAAARGPVEEQSGAARPVSQLLIVPPDALRGVRLEIGSPGRRPWEVAELRLERRVP